MTALHVAAGQVTAAVEGTLQLWLPYALWEVATVVGVGVPPVPVSWARPTDPSRHFEDQFPICVVTSTGTTDTDRHGNGTWSATWDVWVTTFVRAQTVDEVADLAKLYAAAVRAVGTHKPDWDDFARSTDWLGEAYDLGDDEDTRTLGVSQVRFGVTVDGVVESWGWPDVPPALPWPAPGYTADTIDLDVSRLA